MNVYYAVAKGTLPVHYKTSLSLSVVSILPALLLLSIVWFMLANAPEFQSILIWLVVLLPVSLIGNLAQQTHKAGQRITRYSIVEISRVLGGFIIGVLLALFGGMGAAAPLVREALGVGCELLMLREDPLLDLEALAAGAGGCSPVRRLFRVRLLRGLRGWRSEY